MRAAILALLCWSAPLAAQTTLSLDDAVHTALENNPDYLKAHEQVRSADAGVLAAYGAFLPSLSGSFGLGYQEGGTQLFDGAPLGPSSSILSSNYNISAALTYSGTTFVTPAVARATRAASQADLTGQQQTLRTAVADQYLTALEATAKAELQDTLLATANTQLALANGKARVGTGTLLEVQQAQVVLGQKQVARLQAHNQEQIERLKLFQLMGVAAPSGPPVQLTTASSMTPFPLSLDSVLAVARQANPTLNAVRSRERVSAYNVTLARSQYLPALTVGTGIGGYTSQYANGNYLVQQAQYGAVAAEASCDSAQTLRAAAGLPSNVAGCSAYALTPSQVTAIRKSNDVFPFGFTTIPYQVGLSLSLPLFNGFARETGVEQALVSRNSARYDVRSRELQLTTDVTTAYLTLQTAQETAALERQTADQAHTALGFIEQRYKVGLATFVEVSVTRDTYESAENARITSEYDYMKAVSDLEGAVGRPLRP